MQRGRKHDNMMNENSRQPSTGQKKRRNKLENSNYYRGINRGFNIACTLGARL